MVLGPAPERNGAPRRAAHTGNATTSTSTRKHTRTLVQQVSHKLVVGNTLGEVGLRDQLVGLIKQVEVQVVAGQQVDQNGLEEGASRTHMHTTKCRTLFTGVGVA